MENLQDTKPIGPAPATLEVRFAKKVQKISYEQAFVLACSLIEQNQLEAATALFARLEKFTDRGPRAFIMQAFCEASALHFANCSKPLVDAFNGDRQSIAADLHNAFVSYHVGIRLEAIAAMADLVNKHHDLPTLCLLLGDMFGKVGNAEQAKKCWSLAVRRDWPNGAVALVAAQRLQRLATRASAAGDQKSPNGKS